MPLNDACQLSILDRTQSNVEKPILNGLTLQTLLFYVAAACSISVLLMNIHLIVNHLICYVRPREQRQIIRIAIFPIVLAAFSCFAIYKYPDSVYLQPIRDIYQSVVLCSFFLLVLEFANHRPRGSIASCDSRDGYTGEKTETKDRNFIQPSSPSGRVSRNKWIAVYACSSLFVLMKIVEMATQAAATFCETSFNPSFANLWVLIISDCATLVSVVVLTQLCGRWIADRYFEEHAPTAKITSIVTIVVLLRVQELMFRVLVASGAYKITPTFTRRDLQIGIPNALICFEQVIVSVWFAFAYSDREYHELAIYMSLPKPRFLHALIDSADPRDLIGGFIHTCKLIATIRPPQTTTIPRHHNIKPTPQKYMSLSLPVSFNMKPQRHTSSPPSLPPPKHNLNTSRTSKSPQKYNPLPLPLPLLPSHNPHSSLLDSSSLRQLVDSPTRNEYQNIYLGSLPPTTTSRSHGARDGRGGGEGGLKPFLLEGSSCKGQVRR